MTEEENPMYLTTETDAGFRAVMLAVYNNPEIVETQSGMGEHLSWVKAAEHCSLWVFRDGYHSRIPNPNYKPPREPQVGDVYGEQGGDYRILLLDEETSIDALGDGFRAYSNQIPKGNTRWFRNQYIKDHFNYICSVDLSPLLGDEDV